MLQAGPCFCANLPEELLASVFKALDHPRDLLACACVCKAWRNAKAKAILPVLNLDNEDLKWLIQLNHVQMAAVRDVHMSLSCTLHHLADETASIMLLTFICGRLSMLQQLRLYWGDISEAFSKVGYIMMSVVPDMLCKCDSSMALQFAGRPL